MSQHGVENLTAHLFRENSGKMIAVLLRHYGVTHLDTIMDVVQDAFEAALLKWRFSGLPENPSAWLMKVAKNKAFNAIQRENKSTTFLEEHFDSNYNYSIDENIPNFEGDELSDSQLRLLFLCCHPKLSPQNQIISTLYILCGFGIPEIANALLMKEEAAKKALSRSKKLFKESENLLLNDNFHPSPDQIDMVNTITYLMFNEGYKTTRSPQSIDHDLCFEAIRLTKLILNLNDENKSETQALLALMFFNLSRFESRFDEKEIPLTLEEQNRNKWNTIFIEEGFSYLKESTSSEKVTRYHVEACIASLHAAAPSFAETPWPQIAALYNTLENISAPNPLIELNRIIAQSYFLPFDMIIEKLDSFKSDTDDRLQFLLSTSKGDIYKRNKKYKLAAAAFQQALNVANSPTDFRFVQKKIEECMKAD